MKEKATGREGYRRKRRLPEPEEKATADVINGSTSEQPNRQCLGARCLLYISSRVIRVFFPI